MAMAPPITAGDVVEVGGGSSVAVAVAADVALGGGGISVGDAVAVAVGASVGKSVGSARAVGVGVAIATIVAVGREPSSLPPQLAASSAAPASTRTRRRVIAR